MKEQSEDNLTPLEAALERRRGAPTKKTPEICAQIIDEISKGQYLTQACKNAGIIAWTFYTWMSTDEELKGLYARACEIRAEILTDEIEETAKDGSLDWQKKEDDGQEYYQVNHEHIARSRLIVDTLKWKAAKLNPKKYGDKQQVEVTGNLVTNDLSKVPQNVLLAAAEVAGLEAKSEDVGGVQDEPEHAAD